MAAERRHLGGTVTSCEGHAVAVFSLRFAAAAGSSAPSTGMDTRRSLSWMFLATVVGRLDNVIAERSHRGQWDSSCGLPVMSVVTLLAALSRPAFAPQGSRGVDP